MSSIQYCVPGTPLPGTPPIWGLIPRLNAGNYDAAVALAELPERIRGYGYVKRRHLAELRPREAELLAAFKGAPEVVAAE